MITVRLTFKVIGIRRTIRVFIRPESTINTSSHAIPYATMAEAEQAADATVEHILKSGRLTFIGADYYTRP